MKLKMKAYVLTGTKTWEIQERTIPEILEEDDVLVKTKAVGVCGSDITAWKGVHPHVVFPRVPGHEAVGEVIAIGSGVKNISVGDHVAKENIDYCGHCYACTHGRPNVCRELQVWGFEIDGGNMEYFVSKANKLYNFPKEIDYQYAAMIEPLTIGAEVNDRAQTKSGDLVLVHGLGPAGILIADWAKHLGARVIGSDMIPKRLELAKAFGFDYVINPSETNVSKFVMKVSDGEGANVIIDACGAPGLLEEAVNIISPAGRIVPITFNFTPKPIDFGTLNMKEAAIIGSRLQSGKFPVVIKELPKYIDHLKMMVTHIFPNDKIEEAFETAASGKPDVGKVIISYNN